MKKRKISSQNLLFVLILVLLIFPLIQRVFNIVKVPPLKGYYKPADEVKFTKEGWFEGEYQEKEELYLAENFGFREFFIRINNQIDFLLFKKAHANSVIIGKQNYLYEGKYLLASSGRDFLGYDSITTIVSKMKFIQEEFKKRNKTFLLVLTPGKGTYYSEYAPDKFEIGKHPTNYKAYIEQSAAQGVNCIDFNGHFLRNKEKAEYPLYPKYGIHWSYYGMVLSLDSLLKKVEELHNVNLHDILYSHISIEKAKKEDSDILYALNLLVNPSSEMLAYPNVVVKEWASKFEKPSLLVIGDSFYWKMMEITNSIFNPNHFWYYNRELHSLGNKNKTYVTNLNIEEEIAKHDIFILMSTEANLDCLGWGFINRVYDYFKYGKIDYKTEFWARVSKVEENIRSNKEYYKLIEEKALKNNIPVDSALRRDAIWIVQRENN